MRMSTASTLSIDASSIFVNHSIKKLTTWFPIQQILKAIPS